MGCLEQEPSRRSFPRISLSPPEGGGGPAASKASGNNSRTTESCDSWAERGAGASEDGRGKRPVSQRTLNPGLTPAPSSRPAAARQLWLDVTRAR
eukprot:750159-Pyramimonas_sp.AAC.1